jgi:hypothetical protein
MDTGKIITAKLHPSGFHRADSNFYSLTVGNDNNLYYTLCSHDIDTHGRVYRYDPDRDKVELFMDLGVVTGEVGKRTLPQGKSHTPFFKDGNRMYLATHYGYFKASGGKEEPAAVPDGYQPYPGGHFMEVDMGTGSSRVLATAPKTEGIITMCMDPQRQRLYGLTWPRGYFIYYDMEGGIMHNLGAVSRDGEVGTGDQYFCLCRTFVMFPETGDVYFTNPDGEILCFFYEKDAIEPINWAHMRRDIFGYWDPYIPGHQGYNWRPCKWHPQHEVFYGVHPKSGYLFVFDPGNERLEVIDRICSEEIRSSGTFESFRYGYLTLDFSTDDPETIYYISGFYRFKDTLPQEQRTLRQTVGAAPLGQDLQEKTDSYLSFVTYHLPTGRYEDHGVIKLEDGRYPVITQSIAVHPDGRIYTVPMFEKKGEDGVKHQCDLISFEY